MVQSISGGVLPHPGEAGPDLVGREADGRSGLEMEPVDGGGESAIDRALAHHRSARLTAAEPPQLAISGHHFHAHDPRSHRPIAHRARPRGIGRHHAAERRPATAGWVGRQPELVLGGSPVEFPLRDVGAGDGGPGDGIDFEGTRHAVPQIDDDPVADGIARYPAAGAPGRERRPGRAGPGDERLQLADALRDRDTEGDEPVDSRSLGIRGARPGIGIHQRVGFRPIRHAQT